MCVRKHRPISTSNHAESDWECIDVQVKLIDNMSKLKKLHFFLDTDILKSDLVIAFVILCGDSLLFFSAKFLMFSLLDISQGWKDINT